MSRLLAFLAIPVIGCTAVAPDAERLSSARAMDPAVEAGVVALLNDPSTDFDVLDLDVPLNSITATNLIDHRDGPDGIYGTSDDDLFDDIAEIDAVSYVGPAALLALEEYAIADGWVATADLTIEGVTFTATQAEATLSLVNDGSEDLLDVDVALDSRAVQSILDARPVDSLETLASLYYVGTSALTRLRDFEGVVEPEPAFDWAGDQFVMDEADELPDIGSLETANSVNGVPDLPVTVRVVIDVLHDAPETLSATLYHPDGTPFDIWLQGSGAPSVVELDDVFEGDQVNAHWQLVVTDHVAGDIGELWGWALEIDAL